MNEQFDKWFKEQTKDEYITPNERAWAFAGWKASRNHLWHPIETAYLDGRDMILLSDDIIICNGYYHPGDKYDDAGFYTDTKQGKLPVYNPSHYMICILPQQTKGTI
jgi:hypothetical protein